MAGNGGVQIKRELEEDPLDICELPSLQFI